MENDLFKQWLQNEKGLKERSARDVVSRLKRAEKFMDLKYESSYDEIVEKLERNKGYCDLKTAVKPQVKRAIKLYKEYNYGS
ncbi:hypothetical protein IMZ08_07405 [Bacillus luteolus]|uniref:Uncharacterized protein n=1 Tax=Litchfieldia luteola TaxID=682179 RepID=A0ABR9QHB0_9BACI|nr:hypothetical protein [Cytobacillus luteolus]MBE4907879.1 hypothetical protein [Cytobacillus luteolus]MBP1943963.1 hypothetical protein [Cytobacillus luteolus]